jgi:phage terminase small subunit
MARKLTPKQEAFAQHYAVGLNVKDAVLRAGYSDKRPDETGYWLMQLSTVHEAIEEYRKKTQKTLDISCLRVIQEYISIGMSNIKNVVEQGEDGRITVKNLNELPDHVAASIASIEQVEEGSGSKKRSRTKITLWPKTPALESLSKALGFDKAKLDEEMARLEAGGRKAVKTFDPRDLNDAEWEVYKKIRTKMIEQAGL